MSYCVNCGVELASGERKCPLCDTPVINPNAKGEEEGYRPYPKHVERVMRKVDRRFGVLLATLALLVPLVVTMAADMIIEKRLSWSLYVAGALLCIFTWFLLPFLSDRRRPYFSLVLDAFVLLVYLAIISYVTADMLWFLPLALPLVVVCGAAAFAVTAVSRSKARGLYKPAFIVLIISVLTVAVELILDFYIRRGEVTGWSLIVFLAGVIAFAALAVIEKKQKLKDQIMRRLFL